MHFSQIWLLWGAGEARRALHPADQHLQREDLHLPLVLDAHPRRPHRPRRHLPICSLHLLLTPHLPLQAALQKVSSTNLPLRSSIENVLCVRGYQSIYAFSHLCLYCHLSFDSLRIIGSNQRVHCCSSPSPLQWSAWTCWSGSSRSAWSWWWKRRQWATGSSSISLARTLIILFSRWSGW